MDACSCSKELAAETRLTCRTSVLFLWWHSDKKRFSGKASAVVLCGPLSKTRLTHPLLEDVVNDTIAQDNQGHLVPFLEATAFPKLAFTEHNSHHLLLWDRQSLQAFWVQTPLHLGRKQAQNCTVVESSCREPGTPPASWKEELSSISEVSRELTAPASFIWTSQCAEIFGRDFANTQKSWYRERTKLPGCKYIPLLCQHASYFKSHMKHQGAFESILLQVPAHRCWPHSFPRSTTALGSLAGTRETGSDERGCTENTFFITLVNQFCSTAWQAFISCRIQQMDLSLAMVLGSWWHGCTWLIHSRGLQWQFWGSQGKPSKFLLCFRVS